MSGEISRVVRTLVDNLQHTQTPRVIQEIMNQQLHRTKAAAGKTVSQEPRQDPEHIFREAKRVFLSTGISDAAQIDLILSLPQWLGFKLSETQSGGATPSVENVSRDAVLSTIWLMSIPRNTIGTAAGTDELRKQSIDLLVRHLLESNDSRDLFVEAIKAEMDRRGIDSSTFDIRRVSNGYSVDDFQAIERTSALLALMLIAATALPFDLDCILKQDRQQLVRVTAGYVVVYHTMRLLREIVVGDSRSKPFDWPLVGEGKVLSRICAALDLLEAMSADMKCCTLFAGSTTTRDTVSVPQRVVSVFVEELTDYYSDILKSKRGKGASSDLSDFIEFLRSDKLEISKRVSESPDRGSALLNELSAARNRAKAGLKQLVAPEKLYTVSLNRLEARLKVRARSEGFDVALTDELRPVFDSMLQLIQRNKEKLGEDRDRFAEALCFETCFKILDYLGFGERILDLPWVARFIAEKCAEDKRSVTSRDGSNAERRGERIVTAYQGGLVYLMLQTRHSGGP